MSQKKKQSLRRVPVDRLRLGMFVAELCGSWMDHPFWNTRFKLKDPADLRTLHESAVTEVWIDISRGLDVEHATAETAESPADNAARVELALTEAAKAENDDPGAVPLEAELARAAAICGKSRRAVTEMFGEARMGKAVDTEQLDPLVEEISNSVMRNPGALISVARLKSADDYTYMHSVAVCGLMIALARQLGLDADQTREAGLAGLVHDVGKVRVAPEILNKPGKLSDAEFDQMKAHPRLGYELLAEGGTAGVIPLDVCLHHHERVDGGGYPHRIGGDNLTRFARMGAVCDVYDAITSDRPYKAGWDPAMSIRKMYDWSKGHFDSAVFQAFVKTVGIYPIGSLVRLESGLLAVVSEADDAALLKPVVTQVFCTRRRERTRPIRVDLGAAGCQDRIVGWEDPAHWKLSGLEGLWAGADVLEKRQRGAA